MGGEIVMFNCAPELYALFPGVDPLENLLNFIYTEYQKDMLKISRLFVKKPELVELAIQNTLIHIARYATIQQNYLNRMRENEERARGYILSIVKGRCILILQNEKRYADSVDALESYISNDVDIERILVDDENCKEIHSYFDEYSDINSEVLRMYKDGLTLQEIAEELNVTNGVVRKRLSRGRNKFLYWLERRKELQGKLIFVNEMVYHDVRKPKGPLP